MKLFANSAITTAVKLLMVTVAMMFLGQSISAQSSLTGDAFTDNSAKTVNSNFGNNPNLTVSSAGSVYIKFKLSSTLPSGTPSADVAKATLKLYLGNIVTPGRLDIYQVNSPWDEATITSANAPPLGSLVTTTQLIVTEMKSKFLVVDVTVAVRQWLGDDGLGTNGLPNQGLALVVHPIDDTNPTVAQISFDSKENAQTSHEPVLNVQIEKGLGMVQHDGSLTGDGTGISPLGVASKGIATSHLADGVVTNAKLADNSIDTAKIVDGAVSSAKITTPLGLTSTAAGATLSVSNTGTGPAITTSGRVGVGTSTPGEKLSVAGMIQSTFGGFKFPDGTVQTTAAQASTVGATFTAAVPGNPQAIELPPRGSEMSLLSLNVPPGHYLLFATARFWNNANFVLQDNQRSIHCMIEPQTEVWLNENGRWVAQFEDWAVSVGGGGWSPETVTFHTVRRIDYPITLELRCRVIGGGDDESFIYTDIRRLTAVKIGNLSMQ